MSIDYQTLKFEYRPRAVRAAGDDAVIHPVIVVGAGPVGLSAAIDLAQQGVPVVLLDDDDTLSTGSRAICFAKRTLEIFDRLGCGERFVEKGVSWRVIPWQMGLVVHLLRLLPNALFDRLLAGRPRKRRRTEAS